MTNEEMKNELRRIANTKASELTEADKQIIRTIAQELGISVEMKRSCGKCVHSAAVLCFSTIEEREKIAPENDERRYILKPNVDLYFGSIRVNAATLTDELAERIIAQGFETKYFEKC